MKPSSDVREFSADLCIWSFQTKINQYSRSLDYIEELPFCYNFQAFGSFFNRDFVFSSKIFSRQNFSRAFANFAFAKGFQKSSMRVNFWQILSRTPSVDFSCILLLFCLFSQTSSSTFLS